MRQFLLLVAFIGFLASTVQAQTKVYKGSSTFDSDIVMTIENGNVYKGNSTFYYDVLTTIADKSVYSESSTFYNNMIFNSNTTLSIAEFVAIWHALSQQN